MDSSSASRAALESLWLTVLDHSSATALTDDDNFYDLGGTSLHVIMLHTLLDERLGVTVDIVELFDALVTQSFGEWVEQITQPAGSADAPPLGA